MDRAGLRLKLLAQQAAAGDLVLLFADESECLTHPYLAYVWAKRGEDLRVAAPGQAQRRALLGAFDAARHELIVVTSARKRSADFNVGPAIGRPLYCEWSQRFVQSRHRLDSLARHTARLGVRNVCLFLT